MSLKRALVGRRSPSLGHGRSRSFASRVRSPRGGNPDMRPARRALGVLLGAPNPQWRPDVRSTLAEHLVMLGAPNAEPARPPMAATRTCVAKAGEGRGDAAASLGHGRSRSLANRVWSAPLCQPRQAAGSVSQVARDTNRRISAATHPAQDPTQKTQCVDVCGVGVGCVALWCFWAAVAGGVAALPT